MYRTLSPPSPTINVDFPVPRIASFNCDAAAADDGYLTLKSATIAIITGTTNSLAGRHQLGLRCQCLSLP